MKRHVNNNWLICFSGYWTPSYIYGIGNIVLKFHSDGYKILWVNSIPNRNPSIQRAGNKKTFFKNIFIKIKHHLKPLRKEKKGFYILTPFYLPIVENKFIYKLNLLLLKIQISLYLLLLNIKKPVLLASATIEIPFLLKKNKIKKYFHYVADLYSDYRDASEELKAKIRKREKIAFEYADYILVSSKRVITKVNSFLINDKKIIYFPHGVEYDKFANIEDIKEKKLKFSKPIVGYFGSLTMANNQNVYIALAKAGFSVVLIGKITGDYSVLENYDNIYLLGPVEYNDLPHYAKDFDIAIMAWKPSEWIANSNPKKTYEYLALGKPIVCNTIPEIQYQLKDLVYFADTPEEFVEKCKLALLENSELKIRERKQKAKGMDWTNKYLQLKELINA